MWFKRKPKNRRLGREQVLDVKLRSSQVRAARTRMTALSLGAVFATVFGLYLLYRAGDWALDRLVYENRAFAIQEVDVQTDGVISVDQLRRWAGVKPEENLLALDLGAGEARPGTDPHDPVRFGRAHPSPHLAHSRDRARADGPGQRAPAARRAAGSSCRSINWTRMAG